VKIKSQRDFFSGLMFMAFGIAFAWGATAMGIGRPAAMRPGFFPLLLGILLAVLGGLIVFGSLVVETEDGEPAGPWAWRPLGSIVAATALFGALAGGLARIGLPPMGLVAATVALTVVSALAARRFVAKEVAILAVVLVAAAWAVLVVLLGVALPLWPAFAG
jgi:hypothetical protein